MSLHFSQGRLLLKNTTDDEWYYIEAYLDNGYPRIKVNQDVAGDFSLDDYDEYAILRASNGGLYKLALQTNGSGVIDYSFDEVTTADQLPVRIFVKDLSSGLLYQITGEEGNDGLIYPEVSAISTSGNRTTSKVCFCPVTPTTVDNPTWSAAQVLEECSQILPPAPNLGGAILIGTGGEQILGPGGNQTIGAP